MRFFHLLFLLASFYFQRSSAVLNATEVLPLRDETGIITITDENSSQLSHGVADYFTAVFITTSKPNSQGIRCDICDDFEPILRKVSVAISQQAPNTQILFIKADVTYNKQLIKELNLTTIPHVLIFPPPSSDDFHWRNSAFYQYELKKEHRNDALHFANYLAQILKIFISIDQEFQYAEFLKYFVLCIFAFTFLKRVVFPKITNKPKFASVTLSLGILLASITGYKFTQINSVPFIARNPKGIIMYFSGGMGWQFGIEILSVSAMYIVMGSLICAIIYIPKFNLDPRLRLVGAPLCSCALFYTFSYFISCFEIKSPGYPYAF